MRPKRGRVVEAAVIVGAATAAAVLPLALIGGGQGERLPAPVAAPPSVGRAVVHAPALPNPPLEGAKLAARQAPVTATAPRPPARAPAPVPGPPPRPEPSPRAQTIAERATPSSTAAAGPSAHGRRAAKRVRRETPAVPAQEQRPSPSAPPAEGQREGGRSEEGQGEEGQGERRRKDPGGHGHGHEHEHGHEHDDGGGEGDEGD